jgi:methionyl-tRNA formyltransferase
VSVLRAGGSGRVRTMFLGSGTFAVPMLDVLARLDTLAVVAVVTAPPRPAGRGGALRSSPVAARAGQLGISPVLVPGRLRAPESVAEILALDPQLIVLADYGQIVPAVLLDYPQHGALNVHPSLLPRHRGSVPVPAAILAGDAETGVTLMRMDPGLDTGPLVAQARVALIGTETAPDLESRLADAGARLLADALPAWLEGALAAVPQPSTGATLTRPLRRQDGRIDPTREVVEIERQVRAYQPWPATWLDSPEGRLTIWRAHVVEAIPAQAPVSVVAGSLVPHGHGLALVASGGLLVIDEAQLAGGRRMPAHDLLQGHRRLLAFPADTAPGHIDSAAR